MTRPLAQPFVLFLLCLLATAGGGGLLAQITLSNAYFPEAGDTLRLARAADVSVGNLLSLSGQDQTWDFGDRTARLEIDRPIVAADGRFPEADVIMEFSGGEQQYYSRSATEFALVGVVGGRGIVPGFEVSTEVDPARVTRRAPLDFGDQSIDINNNVVTIPRDSLPAAILDQLGTLGNGIDSVRFSTSSNRGTEVDGSGTLLLNGQRYEVLREVTVELITTNIALRSTALGRFTDVTTQLRALLPDSLARFLGPQPARQCYTFWNEDSKEAVVEIETTAANEVTEFTFRRNDVTSSLRDHFTAQARISVYPNPATGRATFRIDGVRGGRYELLLVNMLGRRIARRTFDPTGDPTLIELFVGDLPRGLYLYSLRNERGRTLATKRLLVGGR